MLLAKSEEVTKKRDEPFLRQRPRAERRGTPNDRLLKLTLVLVEQGDDEPRPVTETAIESPFTDTRSRGDLVHRHGIDPSLGKQPLGLLKDADSVSLCV